MTKYLRGAPRTVAMLLVLAWPAAVSAQGWEASGGYSMLRDTKDQLTFPAGWTAGAAAALNRWLSVVADVDGQRKTIPSIGSDIVLTSHAFLAGGRGSTRLGRFTEWAQVCVGVFVARGDAFGSSEASSSFAVQPGLGLDYPVSAHWSARAQLDLRWIRTGEQVRVGGSIVYRRR